jgi:hypothetical protein
MPLRHKTIDGKIPTAIDGFNSIVFLSMDESLSLKTGTTIDLRAPTTLQLGVQEFVVKEVPTSNVSAIPVEIDAKMRAKHFVDLYDPTLQTSLVAFYAAQLGAKP